MNQFVARTSLFNRFCGMVCLSLTLTILWMEVSEISDQTGFSLAISIIVCLFLLAISAYILSINLDPRPMLTIDEAGIYDRRIMHRVAKWEEIERIRERDIYLRLDAKKSPEWLGPKWPSVWKVHSSGLGYREDLIFSGLDKTREEIIAAIKEYMPVAE